ncbi:hypothetical protein [Teichococcus coralli]|uniref:hypothetical protein n=1 Tax=Teichococcus coralli TaxID=2545983 RepID=UPI00136A1953|nr:hypothetical protein [Pseudoroseomonas coralli]
MPLARRFGTRPLPQDGEAQIGADIDFTNAGIAIANIAQKWRAPRGTPDYHFDVKTY